MNDDQDKLPPRTNRRQGAGFFAKWFPEAAEKSSDELNDLLNEKSGLSISRTVPNASAFDAWRQALASKGYQGIWR